MSTSIGNAGKTHDGFDGVSLTTLENKLASTGDVSLVSNSLVFFGTTVGKGATVVASYTRWK